LATCSTTAAFAAWEKSIPIFFSRSSLRTRDVLNKRIRTLGRHCVSQCQLLEMECVDLSYPLQSIWRCKNKESLTGGMGLPHVSCSNFGTTSEFGLNVREKIRRPQFPFNLRTLWYW
jgi:hypothetical protein